MSKISKNVEIRLAEDLNSRLRTARQFLNMHREAAEISAADAQSCSKDINEIKALAYKYGVTLD